MGICREEASDEAGSTQLQAGGTPPRGKQLRYAPYIAIARSCFTEVDARAGPGARGKAGEGQARQNRRRPGNDLASYYHYITDASEDAIHHPP
eukprot:gene29761-4973_t